MTLRTALAALSLLSFSVSAWAVPGRPFSTPKARVVRVISALADNAAARAVSADLQAIASTARVSAKTADVDLAVNRFAFAALQRLEPAPDAPSAEELAQTLRACAALQAGLGVDGTPVAFAQSKVFARLIELKGEEAAESIMRAAEDWARDFAAGLGDGAPAVKVEGERRPSGKGLALRKPGKPAPPTLSGDEKIALLLALNAGDRDLTEREREWLFDQAGAVMIQAKAGRLKGGVPWSAHEISEREIREILDSYAQNQGLWTPPFLAEWAARVILKVSPEGLAALAEAADYRALHDVFTRRFGWTAERASGVVSYSNAGYTKPIRLRDYQAGGDRLAIPDEVRRAVVEAVREGGAYVSGDAAPRYVAAQANYGGLERALTADLGWKAEPDPASETITFRRPAGRGAITVRKPQAGEHMRGLRPYERRGFFRAVAEGAAYTAPEAAKLLLDAKFLQGSLFDPRFIQEERERAKSQRTIAFDLDNTLAYFDANKKAYVMRPGMQAQLAKLAQKYRLALWTAASRERAQAFFGRFPKTAALFSLAITRENGLTFLGGQLAPDDRERLSSAYPGKEQEAVERFFASYRGIKDSGLLGYALLVDDNSQDMAMSQAPGGPYAAYTIAYFDPSLTAEREDVGRLADKIIALIAPW